MLPETEILRLYDNVPKAQAQTIMGNRLFYGNYFESYNLVDKFNDAVQFNYSTLWKQLKWVLKRFRFLRLMQYTIDGWIINQMGLILI